MSKTEELDAMDAANEALEQTADELKAAGMSGPGIDLIISNASLVMVIGMFLPPEPAIAAEVKGLLELNAKALGAYIRLHEEFDVDQLKEDLEKRKGKREPGVPNWKI